MKRKKIKKSLRWIKRIKGIKRVVLNDSLETHSFIKTPEGVGKKGIKTGKMYPRNLTHLNIYITIFEKFVEIVFTSLGVQVGLNDKNVFIFLFPPSGVLSSFSVSDYLPIKSFYSFYPFY